MSEYFFYIITAINFFIDENYYLSILMYFIFILSIFIFSLPGNTIILLCSGFFFGFYIGFLINIISISIGSLIFINFSKTLLKNIFNKYYLKYSNVLSGFIKKSSYEYLILLRLIIGPPLILQNICISILNVTNKKILFSTLIGFTPIMILFSYLGSYASSLVELREFNLSELISFEILLIFLFIIFFTVLKIYFKK